VEGDEVNARHHSRLCKIPDNGTMLSLVDEDENDDETEEKKGVKKESDSNLNK
jgi:hypothetical protein